MNNRLANITLNSILTLFALFITLNSSVSPAAEVCDIDENNRVEQNDIDLIFQARNRDAIIPFDPMDIDRNGVINTDDARICVCKLPTTADCPTPLNQAPTANPGSDQTLSQSNFSAVNLDGSASSDPNGDLLSFLWAFQQRPQNSEAVLVNANTVSASFVPDSVGVYILSLKVTDGFGESSADFVTINISSPSSLQANTDTNTALAGGSVTGNIISNDVSGIGNTSIAAINQNGQSITLGTVYTTAAGGSFLIQADGSYTYTAPSAPTTMSASSASSLEEVFAYTITDESGASSSSTLTITVNPVVPPDNPPVAQDDIATAIAGGSTITGNVLTNDNQGNQPTQVTPVSIASTANGGTYNLQANGDFNYTPPTSLTTTVQEQFPYTITDSDGKTSSATVTITVSPRDGIATLTAHPDANTAFVGGETVTGNVLSNDDIVNRPVRVILSSQSKQPRGTIVFNADGSYSYTPPTTARSTFIEQFNYILSDRNGKTSTSFLNITVELQILVPSAQPDVNSAIASGPAVSGNVLGNDNLGNQPTNITPIVMNSTTTNGGSFSLQNNGSYTYMPPQSLDATIEEVLDYTITDLDDQQSSSTLTITVTPQNRTPVAQPDTDSVIAGGAAITGNVLTNDELGNQPTQVTPIQTNSSTTLGGVFSLQANGSYTYMPPQSLDSVTEEIIDYTITDTDGETSTSTLTITVNPDDRLPVAVADIDSAIAGGAAVSGNVLANDDLGNQPTQLSSGTVMNFQTQQGGIFSLAVDGSYTYMPPATIAGVVIESFDYTITDTDGDASSSTLSITVSPVPLNPLARPDTDTATAGGATATGNVLSNDDPGNQPTLVTAINIANTQNGGTFTLLTNGDYSYIPPTSVSGVITELFNYTITDNNGATSSSTLTITVSSIPLTPVCRPDENNVTAGDGAITDNVLTNDDRGSEPTLVTALFILSTANGGSLNLQASGDYTYTPPATVTGVVVDNFTYTITDNNGTTCESTLAITINPVNLTPLARPDERSTTAGTNGISGDVLVNDDQGNLPAVVTALSVASTPIGGSLTLRADGSFNYTPPTSVTGVVTDLFPYTITDKDGETSSSTLTIIVSPLNLVPFARADTNNVKARSGSNGVQGNVLDNDDKGNLPTEVVPIINLSTQNQGLLNIDKDGNYSYIPPSVLRGIVTETFNYSIFDDDGETSSSTLTITVTPTCRAVDDIHPNKVMAGGTFINDFFIPNRVSGNVLTNDVFCTPQVAVTPVSISSTSDFTGTFSLLSDGSYTYTAPNVLTSEQQVIFEYTATDSDGDTSTASLIITVKPELRANIDFKSSPEFPFPPADITGNVLTNDLKGNFPTTATAITTTINGCSFKLETDGSYVFKTTKPVFGFIPPITISLPTPTLERCFEFSSSTLETETISIPYTITDNDGDSSSSELRITFARTIIN